MAELARKKYQSPPANDIEIPDENKFSAEALQEYRIEERELDDWRDQEETELKEDYEYKVTEMRTEYHEKLADIDKAYHSKDLAL